MIIAFAIASLFVLAGAIAAFRLKQVVHCALALVASLGGLAVIYLMLAAPFAAFAQLLVYIGAVAILIIFALWLTRSLDAAGGKLWSAHPWIALGIAAIAFGGIASLFWVSPSLHVTAPPPAPVTVSVIGDQLMSRFVIPLEVLGLLLTAAVLGGVLLAMPSKGKDPRHE